jgi:hypothetical protein
MDQDDPLSQGLVGFWTPETKGRNLAKPEFVLTDSALGFANDGKMGRVWDGDDSGYLSRTEALVANDADKTLVAWANPDTLTTDGLVGLGAHNSWNSQYIGWSSSSPTVRAFARTQTAGPSEAEWVTKLTFGEWYHIAGVYIGSAYRELFVQGISRDTETTDDSVSGQNRTVVGATWAYGVTTPMTGYMKEARIYNRALSAEEVYGLWDPSTRWNSYHQLGRVSYHHSKTQEPVTAPNVITARKTPIQFPSAPFVLNQESEQALGLVGWWPLGQLGGKDFSKSGFDLSEDGSVSLAKDSTFGNAWDFPGTTADRFFADIGRDPIGGLNASMCIWGLTHTVSAGQITPFTWAREPGEADYVRLRFDNTNADAVFVLAAGHDTANYTVAADTWYHNVLTLSSDTLAHYVDGANKRTTGHSETYAGAWDRIAIGVRWTNNGWAHPWDGLLRDARLYNRILSDTEVAAQYDPATRFDLYHQLGQCKYFIPGGVRPRRAFKIISPRGGM